MKKLLFPFAALALFVAGCGDKGSESASTPVAPPPAGAPSSAPAAGYAGVQAIFSKSCVGCHQGAGAKAGIVLTDHDAVMKGGKEGPIVKAGDSEGSILLQALHGAGGKKQMPPAGPLPEGDIKTIEAWIKDGAKA